MPKYYRDKIADHYLYFTSQCIVEAMHVHASDKQLTENTSAKFFVRNDGSSVLQKRGDLTDSQITTIQKFIKENYMDMYKTWKDFGGGDFYSK
jgi:predicted transcriptional regulator